MKSLLKLKSKLAYGALASMPVLFGYLTVLVYEHLPRIDIVADIMMILTVIVTTISFTLVFTNVGIAFWLRRWRFAFARLATVIVSALASLVICLYLVFF